MAGRASRDKGNRYERQIVTAFMDAGVHSERVPLSGSAGGSYCGDLTFACLGEDWRGECKVRGDGFKTFYGWLADNRALFLKADRQEPLVVVRLSDFIAIVNGKRSV
jgi:Holliday junction resolvase